MLYQAISVAALALAAAVFPVTDGSGVLQDPVPREKTCETDACCTKDVSDDTKCMSGGVTVFSVAIANTFGAGQRQGKCECVEPDGGGAEVCVAETHDNLKCLINKTITVTPGVSGTVQYRTRTVLPSGPGGWSAPATGTTITVAHSEQCGVYTEVEISLMSNGVSLCTIVLKFGCTDCADCSC